MATLDLRRQASEAKVALTERTPLTELDRQRAIATWKTRMVNEHISARVFAQLIPQMMRAGLDPSWQEAISVMVTDELRHGRQCAEMVHALGGEAVAELPEFLSEVPLHEDADPLEGFLRNILSICCLSETVAVALIRAEKNEISTPEMEATLDEILADDTFADPPPAGQAYAAVNVTYTYTGENSSGVYAVPSGLIGDSNVSSQAGKSANSARINGTARKCS